MERLPDRLTNLTAAAGLLSQPLAADQAAPQITRRGDSPSPAQQRRWRHQERPPALPRQQPGQRGRDEALTCTLQGALATRCDLEVSWLVKDYDFVSVNLTPGAL